jgi:hypothetical protein
MGGFPEGTNIIEENVRAIGTQIKNDFRMFDVAILKDSFSISKTTGYFWNRKTTQLAEFVVSQEGDKLVIKFAIINDNTLDYVKSRVIFLSQQLFKQNPTLIEGKPLARGMMG